ncbi:PREDICTED: uncharacterized protein LOC108374135, partial [Rhagoletis zephyria]|uniref:uncharacterized protein LOC108374135 n=1 Tax=Rhagoletis zephyria TaxID=28612 RepID=UPI0008118041
FNLFILFLLSFPLSSIQHRKLRVRRSHSHRKRSETRIALDLPTTDPSADLIFSTDEEPNAPDGDDCVPQYCTVPRARARRLLQSELQRRYMEEIGDNATGRGRAKMPPELIITSPSKGTKITIKPNMATSHTEPDALGILEFPVTFKAARRTNSWHNLNNNASRPVCMARQKFSSSYSPNESKIEELDLKLSLKKRYWAGVKSDKSRETLEHPRPLSWNQQIVRRQHPAGQQSRHAAYERMKKPSREKLDDSIYRKADNEAFLNIANKEILTYSACSQKLLHWQQELNNVGKTFVARDLSASPILTRKIDIQMGALTLGMPEIFDDERTLRIFRKVSQVKKDLKTPTKEEAAVGEHKVKRRSNGLIKIADTSQLISRLTKGRSRARGDHGQSTATRTCSVSLQQHTGLSSNTSKARVPGVNRFKTGGIVVTAVQQSSSKKIKKGHRNNKSQLSLSGAVAGGACKKEQNSNTGGASKLNKTNLSIKSTLSSNTFVRKVKTKLTKKKSNHSRDEPSNIVPGSRILPNVNSIITNNSIYGVPLSRKM